MHWATYRRLEALEAAADHQWMAAVVAREPKLALIRRVRLSTGTSDDEPKTDVLIRSV